MKRGDLMATPTESEQVQYRIMNVRGAKGSMGIERQYDIFFTENGIAFAVTASGLAMAAGAAGAGGFGMVGGLVGSLVKDSKVGKAKEKYQGLSLPQVLALNEKSFYLAYPEVVQVTLKKGMTGISKMDVFISDGKYHCEFSKDQFETANSAIKEKLVTKIKSE